MKKNINDINTSMLVAFLVAMTLIVTSTSVVLGEIEIDSETEEMLRSLGYIK